MSSDSRYGTIPSTSSLGSTQVARDEWQQELEQEVAERDRLTWPDKTLLKLEKSYLVEKLEKYHNAEYDNDIGCWFRTPAGDSEKEKERLKIKLTNTKHTQSNTLPLYWNTGIIGQKFDFRSDTYLAHIGAAVSAANFEGYNFIKQHHKIIEVSHACHESACFNPDHVFLESQADNTSRKDYCGKGVIVFKGDKGTVLPTCNHRETSQVRRPCIGRVIRYAEGRVYRSVDEAAASL